MSSLGILSPRVPSWIASSITRSLYGSKGPAIESTRVNSCRRSIQRRKKKTRMIRKVDRQVNKNTIKKGCWPWLVPFFYHWSISIFGVNIRITQRKQYALKSGFVLSWKLNMKIFTGIRPFNSIIDQRVVLLYRRVVTFCLVRWYCL